MIIFCLLSVGSILQRYAKENHHDGKKKAEIMKKVLEGPITEEIPASILRTHPNITFILDEEAAALLENQLMKTVSKITVFIYS